MKISKPEQRVMVTMTDHGIGIPEDEIMNIFKPFNRAANAKFIGGFGIDLSIVAKILELYTAVIKVTSSINKGTSFEIHFGS